MNERQAIASEEEPPYTAIERVVAMFIHAWETGERALDSRNLTRLGIVGRRVGSRSR
jgi:hypothetical protein